MLGDWVLWKNKNVQIVRTCALVYSFGHIDVGLAHCNDYNVIECHDISKISPIPLLMKFLKRTDGKMLNFGVNIKLKRQLFKAVCQI